MRFVIGTHLLEHQTQILQQVDIVGTAHKGCSRRGDRLIVTAQPMQRSRTIGEHAGIVWRERQRPIIRRERGLMTLHAHEHVPEVGPPARTRPVERNRPFQRSDGSRVVPEQCGRQSMVVECVGVFFLQLCGATE